MGSELVHQPDGSTDAGFRPAPVSPLGFGPFGERPPIPANDQGSSLARTVSADLEEIFAPLPADAPEAPRRAARVHTLGGVAKPAASPSRIAGLGAVAAALLAGLVLGSILLKPHPKTATTQVAAASALPATPRAADLPTLRPAVTQAPPAKVTVLKPAPVTAAPVRRVQPKAAPHRAAPSRSAVMAADRRLRHAYVAAAHAGVSQEILAAAQDRWAATRRDNPARVVVVYNALSADLERRARGHRR